MKRLLGGLFVLVARRRWPALGAWLYLGLERPYKGYQRRASSSSRSRRAPGPASIGTRLAEAGVVRDTLSFRFELCATGTGRRLQAGEYRFDRPMTVAGGRRQDRARRRLPAADYVSRGADDPADGAALREQGLRPRGGVRGRRLGRRADPSTSIRTRAISKAICSPTPTRCRATRPPSSSSRAWWRASRRC